MLNLALLTPEVQQFIDLHLDRDPVELLLKPSPFPAVSMQEIAGQIQSKRKCRQKLPLWYQTRGIYYPPPLALEQCSSSGTAAYKASLCAGNILADLTGGAGVDSYFFSKNFREVIHIEQSAHLSETAAHNLPLLGAANVRFRCGDGMETIRRETADCIYLDPSRRTRDNRKMFLPQEYEPDFIPHLDLLISRAPRLMIKTSPLIDLKFGVNAFKYVQAIHVVAIKNECKEVLWLLGRAPHPDPSITCASILEARTDHFLFNFSMEENAPPVPLSGPLQYLYEPGAAILKAGAFKLLGTRFELSKLHVNSHLYTSERPVEQFPGRSFRILESLTVREFGQRFKGRQVHISTRNFPENAAFIVKKFRLTEGGDDYAFFTTTEKNKRLALLCAKV